MEPVIGIRPRRSICRQMVKLATTSEGSRAIIKAAKAIDENNPPCREGALFERRGRSRELRDGDRGSPQCEGANPDQFPQSQKRSPSVRLDHSSKSCISLLSLPSTRDGYRPAGALKGSPEWTKYVESDNHASTGRCPAELYLRALHEVKILAMVSNKFLSLWSNAKHKLPLALSYFGSTASLVMYSGAQLLTFAILARHLGVEQFGLLMTITAATSLGMNFVGCHSETVVRRSRTIGHFRAALQHNLILIGASGSILILIFAATIPRFTSVSFDSFTHFSLYSLLYSRMWS